MGTRHLTVVQDDDKHEIMVMYGQFDGYPSGHGMALKEAFGRVQLVNGLGGDAAPVANGMGCLAAQVVAHFKDEPGGFYLHPGGTRDRGEEFVYVLRPEGGVIMLDLFGGPTTYFGGSSEKGATAPIWSGPLADFDPAEADEAYDKAYESFTDDEAGPKHSRA